MAIMSNLSRQNISKKRARDPKWKIYYGGAVQLFMQEGLTRFVFDARSHLLSDTHVKDRLSLV